MNEICKYVIDFIGDSDCKVRRTEKKKSVGVRRTSLNVIENEKYYFKASRGDGKVISFALENGFKEANMNCCGVAHPIVPFHKLSCSDFIPDSAMISSDDADKLMKVLNDALKR